MNVIEEVKKQTSKKEEVKKILNSIYLHLSNPNESKVINLCSNLSISKQKLQYYLNNLKKEGLIVKISYSNWQISERGKNLENWTSHSVTLPPLNPLQQKTDIAESLMSNIKEGIERAKRGENPLVPNADFSKGMTTMSNTFKFFWRPNNYRRQIKVKEKSNSTIEKINKAIGATPSKHSKLINIHNYMPNITLQYGKDTLTGIYSQNIIAGVKEVFLIESDELDLINKRIDEKKKEIQEKIDIALNKFSKEFDILLPFKKAEWSRYEDFVKGIDFIDQIPKEVIIHDTIFKKVYDLGIEYKNSLIEKNPTVHLKNTISNYAINKISPEIVNSIDSFRKENDDKLNRLNTTISNNLVPALNQLAQEMNTHVGLMKDIRVGQNIENDLLFNLKEVIGQLKQEISQLHQPSTLLSKITSKADIFKYSDEIKSLSQQEKDQITENLFKYAGE